MSAALDLANPVDRVYDEVIGLIHAYCEKHGCSPSKVGREALKDSVFIQTVLRRQSVTTEKLRKLVEFLMRDVSPAQAREERLAVAEAP